MNLNRNQIILIVCALILFGIMMRLMPHAPNATPIAALAFVGSLYLGRRWSIILPLSALLLSDLLIGFYDWRIMLSVYGSFALIGFLSWICRKYNSFFSTGITVIAGSLVFFLLTNTTVWLFSPWYEKSISGLLYSYELGLPFLRNMLAGDIAYTFVLIGVFETAFVLSRVKVFSAKTA